MFNFFVKYRAMKKVEALEVLMEVVKEQIDNIDLQIAIIDGERHKNATNKEQSIQAYKENKASLNELRDTISLVLTYSKIVLGYKEYKIVSKSIPSDLLKEDQLNLKAVKQLIRNFDTVANNFYNYSKEVSITNQYLYAKIENAKVCSTPSRLEMIENSRHYHNIKQSEEELVNDIKKRREADNIV